MKTPYFTRVVLATGFLMALLMLSALAKVPPFLNLSSTNFNTGAITSGAGAGADGLVIFAGGHPGTSSAVTNIVQVLDLKKKTVTTAAPLPTARAGLGLVEALADLPSGAKNFLYAIGGVDGSGNVLNTVEVYDFGTGTWSEAASMPTARAYLSVVVGTDGKIYAIGGSNGSGHALATVEAYDPVHNTWAAVSSLNTARSHCAAALVPQNLLFVAGGIDASGNYLNSTEGYSLAVTSGSWGFFPSMKTARADFGLALAGDLFLHAIGGHGISGNLKSIEGYNPSTGVWTTEPEALKNPRAKFAGVEGLDGSIYFLGGSNNSVTYPIASKGVPPLAPTHTVDFVLHNLDEPFINGARAMDEEIPLTTNPLIVSLLAPGVTWASFPAVTGTIEAGGTANVVIQTTLGVSVLTTFTLSTTDLDGGSPQVIGQVEVLIGLGLGGTTVNIPITTPITLTNRVLELNISTPLAVDLNLGSNQVFLEVAGLNGKP